MPAPDSDDPDPERLSMPTAVALSGNLLGDLDTVLVSGVGGSPTQVRLTFASAEIGNGNATDAGTMTNQDGGPPRSVMGPRRAMPMSTRAWATTPLRAGRAAISSSAVWAMTS